MRNPSKIKILHMKNVQKINFHLHLKVFYHQKTHFNILTVFISLFWPCVALHIRKVLPCNFKPPSYLGEIPWAASSSLNHKVLFQAACESARTLNSFLHFILKLNKEDTVQVCHNEEKWKSIFIPEQTMV